MFSFSFFVADAVKVVFTCILKNEMWREKKHFQQQMSKWLDAKRSFNKFIIIIVDQVTPAIWKSIKKHGWGRQAIRFE